MAHDVQGRKVRPEVEPPPSRRSRREEGPATKNKKQPDRLPDRKAAKQKNRNRRNIHAHLEDSTMNHLMLKLAFAAAVTLAAPLAALA
ncbi:MAG: hypothetical protein J0H99_09510, partial [Rhodospirillales bacterium]|nr:hypothetical protein [Rhodospirillales bacterium]